MTVNLTSLIGKSNAALTTILNAATNLATANVLMKRDSSGNAQVGTPVNSADVAPKSYVDAVTTALTALSTTVSSLSTNVSNILTLLGSYVGATNLATPSSLMARDANGRAKVVDPATSSDIATKNYVDTSIAAIIQQVLISSEKTANFTAVANTHYPVSLSAGNIVATLPDATSIAGEIIEFYVQASGAGNSLYFAVAVGGQTINEQTPTGMGLAGVAELYGVITLRALGAAGYRIVGRC